MTIKKKIVWLVVSCLMALSLVMASCGPAAEEEEVEIGEAEVTIEGEEEEEEEEVVEEEGETILPPEVPKYGGVFVDITGDPRGFDPGVMQTILIGHFRLMHEAMVGGDWSKGLAGTGEIDWKNGYMGMAGAVTGWLAESYEMPDNETIIYHIRPGVHWWNKPPVNGREFTAADAAWCIEREWACDKCYPRNSMPPEDWLISATALDKYTLELKVPPQAQGVHFFQTGEYVRMVPREVVEQYGDMNDWRNVVGTGAFMLTDYIVSSTMTYERNPNYWAYDAIHPENQLPYLDGLKLLIIPDASSRQAAFRTGKVDRISGISVEDWERFMAASPELKYAESFPGVPTMLTGRVDKEELAFKDVRVRQALNLAVNQHEILDDYYKGKGTLLAYPFLPTASFSDVYVPLEEMPAVVQELFEYKPDKAEQLLAEAGYPTGFKTEVVCNSNEVDLLSIIREYLLAVGVDMEIKPVEGGAHFGMKKGRTYSQMILGDTLPHAYWKMHEVRPESSSNNSFWGSDETRAAYNEVMNWVGKDDTKVKQAIKNVVPHIIENAWGVWLPQRYLYTLWWPWVQNYRGELNFGSVADAIYRIWIWYDDALKKSMGY